jgi:DNA-binding transcriptional MerR regulator
MSMRRIGALAAVAGVTVDTLRFYEHEGLLPRADRTAGGFRLYSPESAGRLRFITQARRAGLTLREIRQLVEPDNARCAAVRDVIAERLTDVNRKLRELASFRRTLRNALERCDQTLTRSNDAACSVARQLGTEKLGRVCARSGAAKSERPA